MSWEDYRSSIEQLRRLTAEKRLAEALQLVERLLEKSPGSVGLLVKRAMLIQLQNDEANLPPLGGAVESLERAIELEPDSVDPYVELGSFEYAVQDDPESAIAHFERAASNAEKGLKEALIGLAKCQMEVGRTEEARSTLERARSIFPDDLDLLMLQDEWND